VDTKKLTIDKIGIPIIRTGTIVVGSGAAGLNCAERLFDAGIRSILITSKLHGGTSYCSGSDKQTYYKMSNFGDTADSPIEMAHSLFDGGCMHGDLAYIESLYSLPAFYHLVENGVPFPYNEFGAFVGYKTDHDPRQRATSAGPKTSRLMVETSLAKVRERCIAILDRMTVVRIVTAGGKVCGLVAINEAEIKQPNLGITLFQAENVILATGGPGELYASSVYPAGQVSLHGVALEAGASAVNLGESQFGLTSTKFRWNLSGTYQQVIPSYFSEPGHRNFLAEYFRSLPEMASAIFLKGYQWPFSANRASDFGSSLVDIAVDAERKAGRRVFMDFTQNPSFGDETFDIQTLMPDARNYLNRSQALQDTPYERLAFMNPDSIEIYAEHGIDLHEPLEIAVSFQHNNGGLWVDGNYQTNIEGLFAIGEVAGSHGVARPGGSALNSGQVGGIRVAQHLSRRKGGSAGDRSSLLREAAISVMSESAKMMTSVWNQADFRRELQKRMTESAGFVRQAETVKKSLDEALAAKDAIPGAKSRADLVHAWETRNLLLTHAAFLKSIHAYIEAGGGSRGAYLVSDGAMGRWGDGAIGTVESAKGPLMSFVKERLEDRTRRVKITGQNLDVSWEDIRPLPTDDSWFETVWAEWRKKGSLPGETE
jgi:succinate dehydrogenase/fumarate reductase flavoprotein subunit